MSELVALLLASERRVETGSRFGLGFLGRLVPLTVLRGELHPKTVVASKSLD